MITFPHYRQSQRLFREHTAEISHKTINFWVHCTAQHLTPIAKSIGSELRKSALLQVDETPMHYLIPGTEKAHKGYILVMRNPKNRATYYHWGARRNAGALMDLLGYHEASKKLEFEGTLQCDGYTCYETLANAYQSIQLGACKLGLKNSMFFGTLEADHNNAVLYTLIENCKAVQLNPRDYLEYVIKALHNRPAEELTPSKVASKWYALPKNRIGHI